MNNRQTRPLLLSVTVLVSGLMCSLYVAVQTLSSEISEEEKLNSLKTIALVLYDSILEKDTSVILMLVDSNEGIRWGPDSAKTYQEVAKELNSRGTLYCLLYGCPGNTKKSVREFFAEVKREKLRIEVRPLVQYGADDQYAEVIYDWPGKPSDLWVTDLPNPKFRWLHDAWKFESIFME